MSCKAIPQVAVFDGPGCPHRMLPSADVELLEGALVVDVLGTTLCSSDLHSFAGRRQVATPTVLGHESCGRVVEIAGAADVLDVTGNRVAVGDKITWSICVHCGDCDRCRNGFPQKCRALEKYGHQQWSSDRPVFGGLAERVILRPRQSVCRIPDELEVGWSCLINCAGATVCAMLREAAVDLRNRRVLVTGAGPLGQLAVLKCVIDEARAVTIVDRDAERLAAAESLDPRVSGHLLPDVSSPDAIARQVDEPVDLILELTGVPDLTEWAWQQLDVGGVLVLGGAVYSARPLAISAESVVRGLQRIVGVHNYRPEDLPPATRLLSHMAGTVDRANWFSPPFELEEVDEAFRQAASGRWMRVLVQPGRKKKQGLRETLF